MGRLGKLRLHELTDAKVPGDVRHHRMCGHGVLTLPHVSDGIMSLLQQHFRLAYRSETRPSGRTGHDIGQEHRLALILQLETHRVDLVAAEYDRQRWSQGIEDNLEVFLRDVSGALLGGIEGAHDAGAGGLGICRGVFGVARHGQARELPVAAEEVHLELLSSSLAALTAENPRDAHRAVELLQRRSNQLHRVRVATTLGDEDRALVGPPMEALLLEGLIGGLWYQDIR
mmetsp:Transcript_92408/g.198091  ORF Transcript_92408/g.198091 Transcript_92408/m.198091 type:complete len:229 (+) Transcript_92408:671-1357(+)